MPYDDGMGKPKKNYGRYAKPAKGAMPKGKAKTGSLGTAKPVKPAAKPEWLAPRGPKKSTTPRSERILPRRGGPKKSATPRSQMIAPKRRRGA